MTQRRETKSTYSQLAQNRSNSWLRISSRTYSMYSTAARRCSNKPACNWRGLRRRLSSEKDRHNARQLPGCRSLRLRATNHGTPLGQRLGDRREPFARASAAWRAAMGSSCHWPGKPDRSPPEAECCSSASESEVRGSNGVQLLSWLSDSALAFAVTPHLHCPPAPGWGQEGKVGGRSGWMLPHPLPLAHASSGELCLRGVYGVKYHCLTQYLDHHSDEMLGHERAYSL